MKTINNKMTALFVISSYQSKVLVSRAIAKKLKDISQRVYISYGSTNQMILNELGYSTHKYYNGYLDNFELQSNQNRDNIIVLNGDESIINDLNSKDIIVKGANAIAYENGKYRAAVAVASPNGGTYVKIIMKASCIGARLIIPVTHEKLVPKILAYNYTQSNFDLTMGLPISLFEYHYGEIYTEIDAIRELYGVDIEFYTSSYGIDTTNLYFTFIAKGMKDNLLKLKNDLENLSELK